MRDSLNAIDPSGQLTGGIGVPPTGIIGNSDGIDGWVFGKALLGLFILSSLVLWAPHNAKSATLLVPNHFLTIQEAIDASAPGDTIVVASGTHRLYYGNITVSRMNLTLKSSFGAQETVIEGRGGSPVITIVEGSSAVIDGFTITSVHDEDEWTVKGGGIFCAPTSSPSIINNIVTGNHAVMGGGIYCSPRSSPTIRNSAVTNNTVVAFGGGILSDWASASIINNFIAGNEAENGGGGILCNRGTPRIANNIIWRNKANSGGGISCDRSLCTMVNNTVIGNVAVHGGGILSHKGAVRIINCILWENGDDLHADRFGAASRPDHSNIGNGDFRGLNGNIAADPLFVDLENGDFHLNADSPCVDAGNPDPMYFDTDGSRNDMGAFGGPEPYVR